MIIRALMGILLDNGQWSPLALSWVGSLGMRNYM